MEPHVRHFLQYNDDEKALEALQRAWDNASRAHSRDWG